MSDEHPAKKFKYTAEYSMDALGQIVQELNLAIGGYIETVVKPRT